MSAVAAPRSTTRTRAARRAPARVGVTSVLLIVACAAVLIGIVTLQVAVLRLNSERGDLQAKRDQIVSANSELRGRLGGQFAPGVLAAKASKQGLVLAPVDDRGHGLAWPSKRASRRAREAAAPRRSDRRIRLMLACVCVGICALALRTVQVQLLDGGALARAAEAQQRVTVPIWAPRGAIVDRTGQPLALSYEAVTVGVWPARIPDRRAFAQALSKYTHVDAGRRSRSAWAGARSTCSRCAASRRRRGRASSSDPTLGPLVTSRAIEPQQEPRRIYPKGGLAAQVVGVDGDGLSGVELSRNDVLSARDGLASVSKVNDRPERRPALGARAARARAGAGQERAADARPAHPAARAAGDRRHARAVARQGRHGRRARHAHGRHPGDGRGARRAALRAIAPATPSEWRLRAITDLYEPGSTFKLVTFMGALQEGVITPDTHVRGARLDHEVRRHSPSAHDRGRALARRSRTGRAREILAHSSNVGTITIAEQRLGPDAAAELDPPRSASAS